MAYVLCVGDYTPKMRYQACFGTDPALIAAGEALKEVANSAVQQSSSQ